VRDLEPLVRETSIATLTNIIRSTALNEIAQSKLPSAVSEERHGEEMQVAQATNQASAPLFFDKAHDEFLSKLHDDFRNKYGVEIWNIRIESFKIMNDELADNISRQALVTAETENQLSNLQGQTEIATAQQERDAAVRQIKQTSESNTLKTKNEAENAVKIQTAEADSRARAIAKEADARASANAIIEQAKAEAEAIRIRAEAEAHAISMKAEAEAKRAEMLAKTPLGSQLSLLEVYSGMVAKSNEGVSKVVYCDPSLAQNGNPFSMALLQTMNQDLSALSNINCSNKTGKPSA